ncbi:DUF4270 domain-containing protein [Lutibacter sp.]|uniref:DUF4270 domain-containing protein n=1 Tax=Lutibacter sp. TaxID=1925666 RepID=UPI0025BE023D|nr:DUF4270 domain-containing protein [Lutibacter sp.]MCF6182296.1 DUF4270 domain-containing protein [Lutibacter sp.]
MTTKVVNLIKYISLSAFVFLAIISCEKTIDNVGVNLVNNNNFNSSSITTDVIAENKNIDKVPISNLGQFLLGVYNDAEFGKLKASIITQLALPTIGEGYTYGTNSKIDSVLISIPYQATKLDNYSNGRPQFSIDSVIGNSDNEFKLSVYELKTFLNTLDPNDPSKPAIYYSDKVFDKGNTALYSGNFKINPNDTVSYIKRYMPDGVTVFDIDTLKTTTKSPSIHIPLDENQIKQLFVDTAGTSEFETLDNFQHIFRGLYIEADELVNPNSHLVSLNLAKANMTIFYSDDEDEGETQDLNGNGVEGEQGVRVKHEYVFPFGTIKSNYLDRDLTNSKQSGTDKLYVQGAAGSMATIAILGAEDLDALKQNQWLITDASLTLYVDQNASSNIVPERLFLYNFDDNLQLKDMITEGKSSFGGDLVLDENGNPYKYVFKITDYISDVLNENDPAPVYKLGLKVFNPTDDPTNFLDTKIKDFSWTPKGVVLYGSDASFQDKKATLKISYSELNN